VTEPIEVYHELLEDERIAAASLELLQTGQRERQLTFGDRPLSVALRPQILTRRRYETAMRAAHEVYGALQRLERALLRDAELREELDLSVEEERLALADPGCRASSPSARLHSFFAGRVRYVE